MTDIADEDATESIFSSAVPYADSTEILTANVAGSSTEILQGADEKLTDELFSGDRQPAAGGGASVSSLPYIEGYDVKERIGSGGGGVVYRAWHKNLRKDVVIKKIHDYICDENIQRTEVDVLKNLRHQNLPQVFDYFVINGAGYTVMDFVPGESMQQMLDRGVRFSEEQILKYAAELADAVAYLHSRPTPVIHGDIKPDNIMVTPEDNVCLIDFNISGISSRGMAETYGYTPGYSAPEQYSAYVRIERAMTAGEPYQGIPIDKRSDVYSIGATLYMLYTGKKYDPSVKEKLSGSTSEGFLYVLDKALKSDPSKRFQDGAELKKALATLYKKNRGYRIKVASIFLALILVLVAIGGTVLYFYFDHLEKVEEEKNDNIKKVYSLYEKYDYEGCIDFINEKIIPNEDQFKEDTLADIYGILGRCFTMEEDYENAVEVFDVAIEYDEKPEYYKEKAIALARSGNAEEARQALKEVDNADEDDDLCLALGEVTKAEGDYGSAVEYYKKIIEHSSDDDKLERAYLECAKVMILKGSGSAGAYLESIELLEKGLERLPGNYYLLKQLPAEIVRYIGISGFEGNEAMIGRGIDVYKELIGRDLMSLDDYISLSNLYNAAGRYDESLELLTEQDKEHPGEWRIKVLLAHTAYYIQASDPSKNYDFSEFLKYYDEAQELIEKLDVSERGDSNIHLMEDLYEKVMESGQVK